MSNDDYHNITMLSAYTRQKANTIRQAIEHGSLSSRGGKYSLAQVREALNSLFIERIGGALRTGAAIKNNFSRRQ